MNFYSLLKKFREFYKNREDWEIGEEGDWVKDKEGYHAIIWNRNLKPCTIQSMVKCGKISIRKGDYWFIENVKSMIFLSENIPDEILNEVNESKWLKNKIVIFDIARGLKTGMENNISNELENFLFKETGKKMKNVKKFELNMV
jgi:hypothetical protein